MGVIPKCVLMLNLTPLIPNADGLPGVEQMLSRELVVDLFEPPQREEFCERVVAMRQLGMTEKQVAAELGITHTAAQRAAALQRKMNELGITDPYLPLTEPPEDYRKMRRHHHPRYRFEPAASDAGAVS